MRVKGGILFWTPRIICIVAIVFVSLFAFDSFQAGSTVWHQLGAFLIHLIPSFILLAILMVAWKWELTGGIILTFTGMVWSSFVFWLNYKRTDSVKTSFLIILVLAIPFVLSGILFIISHYRTKTGNRGNNITD